jgi:acetoin utilization deacetylase AcuC-like enzyme
MRAFESQLLPVLERFNPDLILISSGFDSREDDLLGCFSISDAGFARLTQWVMALADEVCQGRVVSLLEGGYNIKGNASAAIAHLKTLAGMSYS